MPLKGKTIRLSDRGHEVLALLAGIYGTEGRAAEIAFEHLYQKVTFTPEVASSPESKPSPEPSEDCATESPAEGVCPLCGDVLPASKIYKDSKTGAFGHKGCVVEARKAEITKQEAERQKNEDQPKPEPTHSVRARPLRGIREKGDNKR